MTVGRVARAVSLAIVCSAALRAQGTTELKRGLVIKKSTTITRRNYRIAADATLDSAVIVVRGDDIILDLNGAILQGADPASDPDQFAGVAILVDGGRNVTIRNADISGYRFAIIARGTLNLTIEKSDLSHTWKPRLYSLVEHESLADWLSFHHNEKDEWLRFGAAMYLDGVSGGWIRAVRAEQGMNGLMLVRTDHLHVEHDVFRFNSGLGIGMYRSSNDTIQFNLLDFNVRGFSNGFYRRGQDSADLLMFEQSSNNYVYRNSATHGGDGLFLWAGQNTMDFGTGGSNDNVFTQNDFSFAPTNAMEATFSRNAFTGNRAAGSDYGLWGGYSYESRVEGNCFSDNRIGIAIEHGQENTILSNRFAGDGTAIRLWGDRVEPGDWGYPRFRDTESRDVTVTSNSFAKNRVALWAANTRGITMSGNSFVSVDTETVFRDTAKVLVDRGHVAAAPKPCEVAEAEGSAKRDRSAIIVDEWGPFDWRSPKIWPIDSTHTASLRVAVIGPAGRWTLVSKRGIASLSATSGKMNDTIRVTPTASAATDWELVLEYRGAPAQTARGAPIAPDTPIRFSYGAFEPAHEWQVKFFAYADSTDPQSRANAFADLLLHGKPMATATASRLDYMWYRPTIAHVPQAHWALEATSTVTLTPGSYTLRTISDDAVRVWVDGTLVIDNWTPHESAVNVAAIAAGKHELRVQYYQVDGWTELRVDIVRGVQRAAGSPGPH